MKKTIWNASLEESMNLVTDKYIQASMKDINENGYWRKILGFFTVLFFQFIMVIGAINLDNKGHRFLGLFPSSWIFYILFFQAFIVLLHYLLALRKVKQSRVLSYYFYNVNMFYMTSLFSAQLLALFLIGSAMVGGVLSYIIYILVYAVIITERIQTFKKKTYQVLYKGEELHNPTMNFIEQLLTFSKKYGGIIVTLLLLFRLLFPGWQTIQQNDLIRTLTLLFCPVAGILLIYFIDAMASENFQGYYLKKYLEDYREFGDYSLEDWYGKKSKVYKEKMKQKQ